MKIRTVSAVLVLASLLSTTAHAGIFGDSMAKCLVRSTTDGDKTLLVQWIFVAMASHPDVRALSNVSPEKSTELSKNVANLFVTLLTQKCKAETAEALKNEGPEALGQSFSVLGQVAMQEMVSSPAVANYLGSIEKHVDPKTIEQALSLKK